MTCENNLRGKYICGFCHEALFRGRNKKEKAGEEKWD
jgi:hypothetical protein